MDGLITVKAPAEKLLLLLLAVLAMAGGKMVSFHQGREAEMLMPCKAVGTSALLRQSRLAWRRGLQVVCASLLMLVWIMGLPAVATAQDAGEAGSVTHGKAPAAPISSIDAVKCEHAAVAVDGHVLFQVCALPGMPVAERARNIREEVEAIANDRSVAPDMLRLVDLGDRTRIYLGEHLVVGFVDIDARLADVPRHFLAERALNEIREMIAAYRHDRSQDVLLLNSGYAVGATLALAVLFFTLRHARRWLDAAATRRLAGQIEALERKSKQLIGTPQLLKALRNASNTLAVLLMLASFFVYLQFVLGLYPWTREAAQGLFDLVMGPLQVMGSALIEKVPDLAFLAILVVVTRYALKLASLFFDGIEQGRITVSGIDSELAAPTYKIVRLLIIVFALVVAYPYIPGSESDAFKGISLFLGLVFSLGSTSFIGNLIAGYVMIYRRAFRIGDRIRVGETIGDVLERGMLVTRLRTLKNEEVVIPNSEIQNSSIVNFSTLSKTPGLILHTTVGIGYETPWRQVEAMLRMAAQRTPGLLATPEPFVLQKALGDFSVSYEINGYTDQPQAMTRIYTALHQNILDVFNEYGVQIMTPAYESDSEEPKLVPTARWFEAPAESPPEPPGEATETGFVP
jgi:small-conductance mechanosensitive channel